VKVEGETGFDLFYIDEGKVHVVFDTIDGRMRSVVSFEPGSIFNLAPAATRCEASGQYQCMTDAVIWQIPGKVLHDPVFAARYPNLMLSVIELLGTLVLTYHTYLTDMLMDDFVTRFAAFISSALNGSDESPRHDAEQFASVFGVHRASWRGQSSTKQEAIIACFTCRRGNH
ncbi:MAG: Crp/Fnr family transcriptional regulator, partial [Bilophila wadsworthia]